MERIPLVDDGSSLFTPGDHRVDTPITCVVTRFGLRSPLKLARAHLDYRRVVRDTRASGTPGLIHSAFLVESSTSFVTLSIWENLQAIPIFGTNIPAHAEVARQIVGDLSFDSRRGPELWSTKWNLISVSHNLNWDAIDFRTAVINGGSIDGHQADKAYG